ncbi:hypothetical protein RND81_01G202000 [Saponaria officinalis]|uniref:H15 domain-containing protein n=1 Tax=Saponaria officinalis TaxID=3572 RepID=A0AAW1N8U9_SAPOF
MDPSQLAAFAAHFQPPPPPQPPLSTVSSTFLHPSPAAYSSQPLPSHPSYTEMITAAILWENSQGKVSGSSKQAIAKYIDRVYSNLPPSHSSLLTHHLKRLKNSGQLVMLKNSYQLPSFIPPDTSVIVGSDLSQQQQQPYVAAPSEPDLTQQQQQQPYVAAPSEPDQLSTPKRKPGRPPKRKQPEEEVRVQEEVRVEEVASEKRRRGRPAKGEKREEVVVPFVPPVSEVVPENVSNGKRRGRPPKKQKVVEEVAEQGVFQVEVEEAVVVNGVAEEVKRRPGRPAKVKAVRGRGRPKKIEVKPTRDVGMVSVGEKRRGRKPKGSVPAAVAAVRNGGGKRRGRKPKGSVPAAVSVVKKLSSGKPRGRPKRNSVLVKHTPEPTQGLAEKELLKKLEDMQSKIRDAVGVLRHYVADQSAPDALSALQQLEELSTMDVTSSPTLTAPPGAPAPIDETVPPPVTSAPIVNEPTMMTFTATSEMGMPLSFSMNVPSMTVTEPFHAPSHTENHEPINWGAPSEAET